MMCNTELAAAVMALSAAAAAAASLNHSDSSSNRLFRPWDAAAVSDNKEETDKTYVSQRKRSKIFNSRRDLPKIENRDNNEASTSSTVQFSLHGSVSAAVAPPRELLAPSGVAEEGGRGGGGGGHEAAVAAATADALYADLSRADLARLGLVCPADYARLRARKQRPKKYRCPHCQVAFSNNGQLRGHIRIHTGERPFACQHEGCGKAFTRNEELTRHRRIHSGVRPYPCPACGKRFGRKDHLKKHARTHQKVQLTHHSSATAAAAAAAFNAAAVGLFPLDPALLHSLMPYPYPGVFGF